jgi:hypothetical protein
MHVNLRYTILLITLMKIGLLHGLSFVGNLLTKSWTYPITFLPVKHYGVFTVLLSLSREVRLELFAGLKMLNKGLLEVEDIIEVT